MIGKIANCQSIVTWHYSGKQGYHFPISAELFLPNEWTTSIKTMEDAGVPKRRFEFQKKWQLALELLDQRIVRKFPYKAAVFDAGYGEVREFLGELDQREITFVAQIPESYSFWPIEIPLNYDNAEKGRPRCHPENEASPQLAAGRLHFFSHHLDDY